ncbi:predicted protein [Arabidopsis lyrata subsp. lyrata]|uniref:Predicted protein n=1 Tax=Arabidopsis lyrata subsp. lyrata TaxID=81972 RepID=D7LP95_ARALL|nr:predicted protein [Arabidopsis lyrata subsp. lyrata]
MNDNNLDETVKRESKREREIHVSALPFLSTDFPLDGWRGLGAVHELIKRERVYEEVEATVRATWQYPECLGEPPCQLKILLSQVQSQVQSQVKSQKEKWEHKLGIRHYGLLVPDKRIIIDENGSDL